ncbi:PepSY domain-containing protein [Aeromonas bivalvium]|uniref:PepSY domain-containing protein n=1 Tax=Aeromonas bivalvium TaxID=440079 RepID=UPI000AD0F59A
MIPRTFFPILALLLSLTPLWAGAQQARLEMAELMKLLVAKGYHDIREVTLTEDRFEVDALDDASRRVRLVVDARSGELLSQERQ